MKKIFFAPVILLSIIACQNTNENAQVAQEEAVAEVETHMAFFGSEITEDNALELASIKEKLGDQDSLNVKLSGTIEKVCQVKGCWMTMPYGEGESMRVSFRDYRFFVPKDVDGKEAVIEGTVYMETTSVDDLRHFAEDEGLSEDEIAAITEPESSLTFVADGVIIKDYKVETGAAKADEQNHEIEDSH
jgi:hypothetical protein